MPGDGRFEWAGFWRGNELPSSYNPPEGFIATANAYNIPADYPARERKLGFEWTNPSRHQRVHEVLGSLPKVSLEDSERLQNDILSIPARRLTVLLAPLASDDEKTRRALAFLRGWDARLRTDSPQAALEEIWQLRHLRKAYREAVLPPEAAAALSTTDMNVMLAGLETPDGTFRRECGCETQPASAVDAQIGLGGNGKAARARAGPLAVGEIPLQSERAPVRAHRRRCDARPHKCQGPSPRTASEFTPSQSLTRVTDFRQMNGPSVRIVLDVGNWDNSRAVNHPGQSGDPESPPLPRPRAAMERRDVLPAALLARGRSARDGTRDSAAARIAMKSTVRGAPNRAVPNHGSTMRGGCGCQ